VQLPPTDCELPKKFTITIGGAGGEDLLVNTLKMLIKVSIQDIDKTANVLETLKILLESTGETTACPTTMAA